MELTHRLIQPMHTHEEGVQNGSYHIIVSFEVGATGQLRPYEGEKPASASYSSEPLQISKGETIRLKSDGDYAIGTGNGYEEWYMCNIIAIPNSEGVYEYTADRDTWITIIANELSTFSGIQVDRNWYNYTQIDEPIGFDDLKMTLKRHEYHGIGAEVSLGNLEFYGTAFDIIVGAYETDIESEVVYEVTGDGDEIYKGQIDISSCSIKEGDYQSVSAKVGEIGAKTTFNNRVDKEVDMNSPKTIDGQEIEPLTWHSVHIPLKHLLYTNNGKQKQDHVIETSGGVNPYPETGVRIGTSAPYIFIPIGEDISTEFGQLEVTPPYDTDDISNVDPQYIADEYHETKYGSNTITTIHVKLDATIIRTDNGWSPYKPGGYIRWHLEAVDNDGHRAIGEEKRVLQSEVNYMGATWDMSCELEAALMAGGSVKYYLVFDIDLPEGATERYFYAHITVKKGSFVKMTMYDNLTEDEPVYADMIMVREALDVVTYAISEKQLRIASDWYKLRRTLYDTYGGGAYKALTNGYHIRGLFTDGDTERNMPLSFKGLIESLSAMDCIGWGFSTEGGDTFVRVERWDWFYKTDEPILTLNDVAEVQIDVDPDYIPTELKIGYKKYVTSDQYNSIESPHGTRSFINSIKAVSKSVIKECDFIADNYAIEETRRAKTQKNETEESTYDENIFVFELTLGYQVAKAATNEQHVGRATEFINALLTPRHMAARWRDYIFSTNNSTPFRFTTGEINYKASFGIDAGETGLTNFAITDPQVENDDITYIPAIFKAEKIKFSYPLTIAQYKAVKANPYRLISVNGRIGWILDFKYSLKDGMADFTLIARNNQINE